MKGALLTVARLATFPTIVLGVLLAVLPGHTHAVVRAWLLVLLAAVAVAIVVGLREAYASPSALAAGPHVDPAQQRLPSLARLEREVALATATAHDVHFRLRPTLRALAAELLAARRGIALDRSPERAEAVLGAETWDLVRPDRPAPRDPHGPGLGLDRLERATRALEDV